MNEQDLMKAFAGMLTQYMSGQTASGTPSDTI